MKVLIVHNSYGKFSGEEAVVRDIKELLAANNHKVISYERSSTELSEMSFSAVRAFLSGIYNPLSHYRFRKILKDETPDIIHIHNLFPLISPSILSAAQSKNIPLVMTVHNYRLVCPNGLYYTHNKICERCNNGKEYWCVLKNCEKKLAKSIGYALRTWWARIQRSYLDNVSVFACLTDFQRNKLIQEGYPEEHMSIVPNMVLSTLRNNPYSIGEYVGFAGRLTEEKGIFVLFDASKDCPNIPVRMAGDHSKIHNLENHVATSIKLLGHCDLDTLDDFYQNSRFIILPSVCYEGFPTVLVEAMLHGKAIICSNIGGLPSIVDDGITGLLVKPGDSVDLAEKIQYLWERPDLCKKMGMAGREKALREYSQEKYYERLIDVYKKAQLICGN